MAVAQPYRGPRPRRGRAGRPQGRGRPGYASAIAALDLGTNNCRLLVARAHPDGFRVIDGYSRIVRLGEGVAATGMLSEAAMARAMEALAVCAEKVGRRNVCLARYVATEACRRAANTPEFLARVRAATGLALEIIPSREEAELTLAGCLPLLDPSIPYALTFDVGGGSAEILWVRLRQGLDPEIVGWISLPCGVVTMTERYGSPEFEPGQYDRMVADIRDLLRPFDETYDIGRHIAAGEVQMLGTAGTVTTIAGVKMGLTRYNRAVVDGCWLDFDAVHEVSGMLERGARPAGRGLTVRVRTAKGRKASSTRWLQRQLNDPYVAEAQRVGLRSRAAFKLTELDDKCRVLRPGQRVVDLGAAPGGWTQVAVQRTRAGDGQGRVIAVDVLEMEPVPGAEAMTLDIRDPDAPRQIAERLGGPADVVLSDMAAPTTGHRPTDHLRTMALCEAAAAFAYGVLSPGGALVLKTFQGGAAAELLAELKRRFAKVRHVKPPASRDESPETYLVATGFRGDGG